MVYGNTFSYLVEYSAFFNFSQLQWEDARTKCRLVGDGANVPLKDIKVTLQNYTSDIGWIDALAAYQPWMEYVGKWHQMVYVYVYFCFPSAVLDIVLNVLTTKLLYWVYSKTEN